MSPIVQYVISMFMVLPLGWIQRRLSDPRHRILFAFSAGISLLYVNFGLDIVFGLLTSFLTYFILRSNYFSPKSVTWVVIGVTMSILTVVHIRRQLGDWGAWTLEFSGPLMTMTLKCISFAYAYAWAHMDESTLSDYEKSHSLPRTSVSLPSLPLFMAYVWFYGTILTGPWHEYIEFEKWVIYGVNTEKETVEEKKKRRSATTERAIKAIITAILTFGGMSLFTTETLNTEWFYGQNFALKIVWLHLVHVCTRSRYYYAWYFAEVACMCAGFGQTVETNEWELLRNQKPLYVELPLQGMHGISWNWNIKTHHFIKHHIFNALRKVPGYENSAFYVAYVFSALWHGLYPGYFIFFLCYGFISHLGRDFWKILSLYLPTSLSLSPYFLYVSAAFSILLIDFVSTPFLVLVTSDSMRIWKEVAYYGLVVMAVGKLVCMVHGVPRKPKGGEREREKEREKKE